MPLDALHDPPLDPASLDRRLGDLPTNALIATLASGFRGRIALVSSFGAEAAVLLHLVARADPAMPVLFLDTGHLFPETLAHRDRLVRMLGLTGVRSLAPSTEETAAEDPEAWMWASDPDACCALRKARPLARALSGFDLWISGRKRHQSAGRAGLPLFEADGATGRVKANPLAAWDSVALERYRQMHGLPMHPLVPQAFRSIGCLPCTSRARPGEDPRAGRWRGRGKSECGIHLPAPARPGSGSMPAVALATP